MKKLDALKALYSMFDEGAEEVYIKIDGTLHDFEVEFVEEQFDGFYTAYPASVALVPKKCEGCEILTDDF